MPDEGQRLPGDPTPGSDEDTSSQTAKSQTPQASPEAEKAEAADQREARQWATGVHLAGLSSFVGIPGIIGVLVVWMIKRDEFAMVDEHGKEALNFQISMLIYTVISIVLVLLLVGILFLIAIGIVGLVLPIIAAIKASDGEAYRYPLTIRIID